MEFYRSQCVTSATTVLLLTLTSVIAIPIAKDYSLVKRISIVNEVNVVELSLMCKLLTALRNVNNMLERSSDFLHVKSKSYEDAYLLSGILYKQQERRNRNEPNYENVYSLFLLRKRSNNENNKREAAAGGSNTCSTIGIPPTTTRTITSGRSFTPATSIGTIPYVTGATPFQTYGTPSMMSIIPFRTWHSLFTTYGTLDMTLTTPTIIRTTQTTTDTTSSSSISTTTSSKPFATINNPLYE